MDAPKTRDVRMSGEDEAFVKGQRIGAFALDALVILVAWVLGFVFALAGYAERIDLTPWALAWCGLFPIAYSGLMEWATGTTIGKHAMRLTVRDLHGRRLSLGHAFGRAICKAGACFPLLMPITLLFTCFGPRGWAIHDWLAGTVVMLKSDTPPASEIAGLTSLRVGAFLLDGVIAGFLSFAVLFIVWSNSPKPPRVKLPLPDWKTVLACASLVPIAYTALLEWGLGSTPGKMAHGFQVRAVDGRRLSLLRSIWRSICKWIACYPLFPVQVVVVLFSERGRTIHDLLAGTVVVGGGGLHSASLPDRAARPPSPPPEGIAARGGVREGGR